MLGRIWRKIWQQIQQLWQRWFGKPEPPPSPEPELPPLSDAGYEQLLFQLLDGVAAGWQPQQAISHLNKRETDRFFRSWLQRFGRRLLESPEPNRQLAQRMVQLPESLATLGMKPANGIRADQNEIRRRGLKEPAQAGLDSVDAISIAPSLSHQIHEIGQQLLARELPPLPEDEYEPMFQRLLAEATRGEAAVLAFLTDLSPRVAVGQWEAWLRGYGEALLAEAEPNRQIARGLIRLGEVLAGLSPDSSATDCRGLGQLAAEIGAQMKAREVVWEIWEYEERVGEVGEAEGWFEEGTRLYRQGDVRGAVAAWGKAVELKPDDDEAWYNRGIALKKLGQYEEAIASYDKAIELKPNDHHAWSKRGSTLVKLGQYEEAIASYDKAIELKSNDYYAWCDRGFTLGKLGRYQEAVVSCDKAVEFKSNYHKAWCIRGVAVANLTHPIQMPSLLIQQNSKLNQPGYTGEIANYEEGLKHCPADTHPEGWGVLQHTMGQAHYFRGKRPNERYPHPYFYQARDCYFAALETLTEEQFQELRLKVVRDLVKVLLSLGEPEAAEDWRLHGLQVLIDLINETPSPIVQNRLEDEFVSFRQWQVDKLVRENQFQLALKTAELDKNRRLSWMLKPRRLEIAATESVNLQSAQADFAPVEAVETARLGCLFSPTTAAILYWHKSSDKLTTFILKPGESSPRAVVADAAVLDEWIGEWDRLYREYGQKGKSSDAGKVDHPWRREMPERLAELGRILGITKILETVGDETGEWNSRLPERNPPSRIEETREDGFSSCRSGFNRPVGDEMGDEDEDETGEWNSRLPERNPPSRIEETREDGFGSCRSGFNRPVGNETGEWNSRRQGQNPPSRIDENRDNPIRHLILIPHRELHRLPLQALFPGYCCTYLPSLQMGIDLSQSIGNPASSGILSIEHPNHEGLSTLYAAEMESHILRQMFAGEGEEAGEWNSRQQGQNPPSRIGENQSMATDAATGDAVIAALQQPHRYLHFNGHASHEKNPAQSALYLSGGDMLTVADIRELNLRGYELAVLSGCETGVTNLETVDAEYVGLASAFLKAGVRQVVSTLWTVQSDASALLMLYFYRKVRKGCSASLALVKAINWLRGLTDAKLERLYRRVLARLSSGDKLAVWVRTELSRLEKMEVGEKRCRKFDYPYFWAAFVVTNLGEEAGIVQIGAGD